LSELKTRCPSLSKVSDRNLRKLLLAVRHQTTYPATDTLRGRPSSFDRETLSEVGRSLQALLEHETAGRVSVQTFVGHYLPILDWPRDVVEALVRGNLSRMEAAQVARITGARMGMKEREAAKIRADLIANHARLEGSQSVLREKVREILGELSLVTSEKLIEAVDRVDDLLRVDPGDLRHLFYEQMKEFFFALRDIQPEEIDDETLERLTGRADELMEVVHSIRRRRRQKERPIQRFGL
jgi:hypothetical protein